MEDEQKQELQVFHLKKKMMMMRDLKRSKKLIEAAN